MIGIILAAGKGTRMKSEMPKVLFPICGKSMLTRVISALREADIHDIAVIYGYRGDLVRAEAEAFPNLYFFEQKEQLGTGHALMQVDLSLFSDDYALIMPGDEPLFSPATLKAFIDDTLTNGYDASLLTAVFDDPSGYGRVIRNEKGMVVRIVEHKDASDTERTVREVNTGVYCVKCEKLREYLPKLSNNNSQKEYYLTDIFSLMNGDGCRIGACTTKDPMESMGVNSRAQLMQANAYYTQRALHSLMEQGVTINNPETVVLEGDIVSENDVVIHSPAVFRGTVTLKKGSVVGPYVYCEDVTIEGESVRFMSLTPEGKIRLTV